MLATAFLPGAFYSASFLEYAGAIGPAPHVLRHRGMPKVHKRHFEDIEERARLRAAIEANFAAPEVQEAIAPYVQRSTRTDSRINVDWDQIYANFEAIEQFLRVFEQTRLEKQAWRRNQDDEDDLMELI